MYQSQYHQQPTYDYHQQNTYQHDAYAMNDMTHRQPDYPYYDEHKPIPATGDGYYTPARRPSQVAANSEKYARRNYNENQSCCDMICCGCCTCCPRWCRYISCCLLLIIIALGIVVGVLAALFKVPTVNFTGVQGTPAFALAGTTVNLNVSLGFVVNNPNIESVTFQTLAATANYHGDTTPLGGGTLHNLHIGSHLVTNISFPFDISLDITNSSTLTVLTNVMSDCGLSGGQAKDIQLDYKVVATVSIIGIPISVPYSSSVSFKCPVDQSSALTEIQKILAGVLAGGAASGSGLGGLLSQAGNAGLPTSLIPSGVLPTGALPSGVSIPTSIPSSLAGLVG